jgi:hypothetical protein
MLFLVDRVECGRAVRQMGVVHQTERFEQFEGPVDGGDVHTGGDLAHLRVHLIGRGMTQLLDGLEDELPLRGQA